MKIFSPSYQPVKKEIQIFISFLIIILFNGLFTVPLLAIHQSGLLYRMDFWAEFCTNLSSWTEKVRTEDPSETKHFWPSAFVSAQKFPQNRLVTNFVKKWKWIGILNQHVRNFPAHFYHQQPPSKAMSLIWKLRSMSSSFELPRRTMCRLP